VSKTHTPPVSQSVNKTTNISPLHLPIHVQCSSDSSAILLVTKSGMFIVINKTREISQNGRLFLDTESGLSVSTSFYVHVSIGFSYRSESCLTVVQKYVPRQILPVGSSVVPGSVHSHL